VLARVNALLSYYKAVILLGEDMLKTAVQITVIGGAIWSIVSYVILKPLNTSIMRLEKSLDIMTVKMDESNKHNHDLELKVATVERDVKSAHKRLDFLLKFCRQTYENFPDKDR
jgi:uncharacterized protein YoxC